MIRCCHVRAGATVAVAMVAVAVTSACTSSGAGTTPSRSSALPPNSSSTTSSSVASSSTAPVSRSTTPSSTAPSSSGPSSSAPSSSGLATSGTAPPDARSPRSVLAGMSEADRVGQLIMVDCPSSGVAPATVTSIRTYHVGSVILDGNSYLGVARTHALVRQLQTTDPGAPRLFVATAQEGGTVQRMRGPGFSPIPSAVDQGRLDPATLQADATTWARQLRSAGITVDLAPVLDTVPPGFGPNPPIGDLDREYGRTPGAVSTHGVAVAEGLAAGSVAATVKHFPGLGRVHGNTDTTSGVTDPVTTRHDAYLAPFADAVRRHVPFVMMSTAVYSRIDAGTPAAFSPTIVSGMLRGDLGFRGIVITDDVGAAAQVRDYPVGDRAVAVIAAGGTIVLTVDPSVVPAMTAALLSRAHRDAAFRRQVDAAALLVLQTKAARGLL